MEGEHDANLSKLLAALGSLRLAFQEQLLPAEGAGKRGRKGGSVVGNVSCNAVGRGSAEESLLPLITTARSASFPKKRVVALQWARALFMWNECVIDTMLLLAGSCAGWVAL